MVALALTYVRGAWVGLAAGAVVVLLTVRRRSVVAITLVVVVLAALAALPGVADRLRTIGTLRDDTTRDRLAMIKTGLSLTRAYPVTGIGPGQVKRVYPVAAGPDALRRSTSHLHNTPLQIAVERGIPGLLAWIAIFVAFLVHTVRLVRRLPDGPERTLVIGVQAAIVSFLVAGLFEYNFGDTEVAAGRGRADGPAVRGRAGHVHRRPRGMSRVRPRWRSVRALIMDVDGVLTDGGLYYTEHGDELKRFDVRDGQGLVLLRQAGILTAIVTGKRTTLVARRADELGIAEVHQGVTDKAATVTALLARHGVPRRRLLRRRRHQRPPRPRPRRPRHRSPRRRPGRPPRRPLRHARPRRPRRHPRSLRPHPRRPRNASPQIARAQSRATDLN